MANIKTGIHVPPSYGTNDLQKKEIPSFDIPVSSSSEEGSCIPIVYGTVVIEPNLIACCQPYIFEEDGVYYYKPDCWYSICMGKIQINTIITKKGSPSWSTIQSSAIDVYEHFNDGTQDTHPHSTGLTSQFYLRDNNGTTLQYINKLPGVAHIFFDRDNFALICGNIPVEDKLPPIKFNITRILETGLDYENMTSGSNPVAVVYDILTNPQFGLNVDSSKIDTNSFNEVASKMNDKNYGYNIIISQLATGREILNTIQSVCGFTIYKTYNGIYKLSYVDKDTISAGTYETIVDTDLISFNLTRADLKELPNTFVGEYEKQSNDGKKLKLSARNPALIDLTGEMQIKQINIKGLGFSTIIASQRFYEIAQDLSQPYAIVVLKTNLKFNYLYPGDIIKIYSEEHNVNSHIYFKVLEKITYPKEYNEIQLTLKQANERYLEFEYYAEATSDLGFAPILVS